MMSIKKIIIANFILVTIENFYFKIFNHDCSNYWDYQFEIESKYKTGTR